MKRILILAAAALAAVSCFHVNKNYKLGGNILIGTGPVVSRNLDLADFTAIRLSGGADITFTQADTFSVVLRAREGIIDSLVCSVQDGELYVGSRGNGRILSQELSLDISAPELTRVLVQGSADFSMPDGYHSDGDLAFRVQGAGDIDISGIACRNLSFTISGAGDIEAKELDIRECLNIKVSGAGDVTAEGRTQDAVLEVSGAGDIDIRNLRVDGDVRTKTAGASRIRR